MLRAWFVCPKVAKKIVIRHLIGVWCISNGTKLLSDLWVNYIWKANEVIIIQCCEGWQQPSLKRCIAKQNGDDPKELLSHSGRKSSSSKSETWPKDTLKNKKHWSHYHCGVVTEAVPNVCSVESQTHPAPLTWWQQLVFQKDVIHELPPSLSARWRLPPGHQYTLHVA